MLRDGPATWTQSITTFRGGIISLGGAKVMPTKLITVIPLAALLLAACPGDL